MLPDYKVFSVAEGPFPMIEQHKGATAEGLFVGGLTEADVARLDYYEGAFDYALTKVTLADGAAARTYLPAPGKWTPAGPWDLSAWEAEWGAISRGAAQEVMSYFGSRSCSDIARMFPMIRARAASKLRALDARHGALTLQGKTEVLHQHRAYAQFYALDEVALRHQRFDGSMSEVVERAAFVAADAALVLPYDPVRDRVLLVEQIRVGPLARGDRQVWQLEPIAGRIDPGETPQEAARREALEEAGLTLGNLETIAEVYPSPGTSTEFHYLFIGLVDLPDVIQGGGGLESEQEDIRTHILDYQDFIRMAETFALVNGPILTCAYWLAHHRDRLRLEGTTVTPRSN